MKKERVLIMVKKLIDMMGAEIEVKSLPGKGSEFTVTFKTGCALVLNNP